LATITSLGYALLCALHKGPLTGYELVRRMRQPIGYYWTARQSQIYPELTRLGELGLITSSGESGPGPHQRMTHNLTTAGRAALALWLVQAPTPRPPRDELVLKTYAVGAADSAAMRALYLAEARRHEERLEDYRTQRARMVARGADDQRHPDFGAFATLKLGLGIEELYAQWCRWLADQLEARG
jgi:DNA-binding PadR family transcriptional regulator